MQYTWQLALVLVPVYFIKHLVSCYNYLLHNYNTRSNRPDIDSNKSTLKIKIREGGIFVSLEVLRSAVS